MASPNAKTGTNNPPFPNDPVDKCREKVSHLLSLFLADKTVKKDDATDLIQTLQKVESMVTKILNMRLYELLEPTSLSKKIFLRTTTKLQEELDEYMQLVIQYQKTNQLDRALSNTNVRRQIEQQNSAVLLEANILEEKNERIAIEMQEKGRKFERKASMDKGVTNVVIEDPDGQSMWEKNLGKSAIMAPWDKFIKHFASSQGVNVTDDQKKALKHILDNSNTGFVSSFKFSEFLRGFGGFKNCLSNVAKLLNEKYFHGFLTIDESRKFLEGQAPGTFLVRFSSSRPGSFAVAFVQSSNKVTHVIIRTTSQGFAIQEQNQAEKFFHTVQEVVQHYSSILLRPFVSTLPEEPWFYGDISGDEAEKLLTGKKAGMFLVRFSSQPGHFADRNGKVSKCLIASNPAYYIADMEGSQYGKYETMRQLIQEFNSLFKYPLKKSTNQVNNATRKKIATEIFDTEKSYVKSLSSVLNLFVQPLTMQYKNIASKEEIRDIFGNVTEILDVHQSFYNELEKQIPGFSDETLLGIEFINLAPKLESYTKYVNNYNNSLATLNKCMKRDNFRKFIETSLQKPESDQNSLTSYLIQPVQRIPRYILLVSDLVKHTETSHVDYEDLVGALDKLKHVADAINESKRRVENEQKVAEIQSLMLGDFDRFAVPGRMFVREGDFMEKSKKSSERHVFLLSDMIVLAKKKSDKFTFKQQIILKNTKCVDIPDKVDKFCFKITGSMGEVILTAPNQQEKESWFKDINQVISGVQLKLKAKGRTNTTLLLRDFPVNSPQPSPPPTPPVELKKMHSSNNLTTSVTMTSPKLAPKSIPITDTMYEAIPTPVNSGLKHAQHVPNVKHTQEVGEWKEASTADGRKYYYNTVTRQTSWTKPEVDDVELALAETQLELEEIELELEQSSKAYETGLN